MIPEPGQRFGPYEILGRLGGGGMGLVFRAWDSRLHREVAIKLLHDEFAMSGMRERFLREARAASALNHPNICTIFDIGDQGGDPYLVMELLEGETLKDRIAQRVIPVDDIVCYAKECADALAAAHAKGIVHRDVKPANIFLVNKPNGKFQAKVLDFGLAKIEAGTRASRGMRSMDLTTAGATVGTLAYMSPEQARGEALDARSDLFSLGVVMYEMATRQVPFKGTTSALVFVKLLNHAPEPVRDWNEAVPRDLEKIIFKLLNKERTARYQSAVELEDALKRFSEKGTGGGWLRKAVVPLVKAADPVARERRLRPRFTETPQPQQDSQADSDLSEIPSAGFQSNAPQTNAPNTNGTPGYPPQSYPAPAANYSATPLPPGYLPPTYPDPSARQGSGPESFLRPVARVPRGASPGPAPAGEQYPAARHEQAPFAADAYVAKPPSGGVQVADASGIREPLLPAARPSSDLDSASRWPLRTADSDPTRLQYDDLSDAPKRVRRTSPWWWVAGIFAMACVLLAGIVFYVRGGRFRPMMLTEKDPLVLTSIENRTGNKALDGTIAEGLQVALSQSPYLLLLSRQDYRTTLRQLGGENAGDLSAPMAHQIAEKLAAKAYLHGVITGAAPYVIHVDLQNAVSNEIMASTEETVPNLEQIPAAVDRISDSIRSDAGEDSDSITRSHIPLAREATGNLDALHQYVLGEAALLHDQPLEALKAYREATTLDPKFVAAHLRLVTLYRQERADLPAAESARQALAAAVDSSERTRTMAQYAYEMNASGDYPRATAIIRQMLTTYPHDSEALASLSRVLRLEGKMSEALQAAQQAYASDPLNADAYTQAEIALIGLDRYDAALQLDSQVQRLGLPKDGIGLIAAYLSGRQDLVDASSLEVQSNSDKFTLAWDHGLYLDNAGKIAEGTRFWRDQAANAAQVLGFESASSALLAQGALDRALIGDCVDGLSLAHEADAKSRGPRSLFNAGMAESLCGDLPAAQKTVEALIAGFPQNSSVAGYYLPDLKAALALATNDPEAALEALKSARQYDLVSLTPYLRGRAHVALRQVQIGIVDFQTLLSHRGVTFTVGSDVYPMAEIGVARAFADTGDKGNSASAYKNFLELWKHADANQPLLTEAIAKSH